MTQQSQDGLAAEAQELLEQFSKLKTEPALKQWERGNRDKLRKAPFAVREAFDGKWNEIVKEPYFQPVTDIDISQFVPREKDLPGRIDPNSKDYKTERVFVSIEWEKTTYYTGKGLEKETFVTYDLRGTHRGGHARVIKLKCKPDRLQDHLGQEIAAKILSESKKNLRGKLEDLELPVLVEGYWEVRFAGRASKEEKEDVEIQWEGRCLQMQREVPVVLPGRYIEVVDNARHPVYIQNPNQPRKIVGWVSHFPYTTLREATRREYVTQKAEGDKITRALRRQEEEGIQ